MPQDFMTIVHQIAAALMSYSANGFRRRFLGCLLAAGAFWPHCLIAQFADQSATAFSGVPPAGLTDAAIAWGDVNNDGYLDFVVAGASSLILNSVTLYVYNPSTSQFAAAPSNINVAISRGDLAFGDFDMDGRVDLALMGADLLGNRYLHIYRNLGTAPYFASPITLPGVSDGSLDWGDMDNDGDLDLLVTGLTSSGAVTRIYQNNAGNFLEVNQPLINPLGVLTGVYQSDGAWGDYDNDGDLDILINGLNLSGQPVVRLFRNLGNGAFENIVASFTSLGLYDGAVAWGDYNNDGLLDVLLCGKQSGSGRLTTLYQNQGNGVFSFVTSTFPGIERGQAVFGDMDNDNFLDVILTGQSGPSANNRTTGVYRNVNGTGVFTLAHSLSPAAAGGAAISVADFDLDQRLDILYTGNTAPLSNSLRLFKNTNTSAILVPPAPPTGLSAVQSGDTIIFFWNPPSPGLSYNLYVSTGAASDNRKAANAQLASGFRRIVGLGNVQRATTWKMVGFTTGAYFWGVQSIDQRWQGSPFAAGGSFNFVAPNPVTPVFTDATATAFSAAPPGVDQALLAWGDYDNDGDLDFVGSGSNSSSVVEAFAYRNNGNGTFTRDVAFSALLNNNTFGMPLVDGQFAFGDFDGDGNLDLAAVGNQGATGVTTLFRNLGPAFSYGFSFFTGANSIPNVGSSSIAWGDHDNDGDQDLLIMGISGATVITEIYSYNSGTGAFVRDVAASASLPKVRGGRAAFADFDRDGYLDLVITGREDISSAPFTRLYRNQGDGTFANFILTTQPQNLINSRVSWGDYNNDGYPDLLICGNSNPSGSVLNTQLFLNLAGQDFALQSNVALTGVESGSAEWGDYNDDGFLDILLCGTTGGGPNARITEVYQNNRQGGFVRDVISSSNLQNLGNGAVAAWGDYDNDGKIDILITGNVSGVSSKSFHLYRNVQPTANLTPFPPQNIAARLKGFGVELSWDLPQYIGTGPKINQGYTYNLYVKAAGSNTYLISPLSDTLIGSSNGKRRVVRLGNTGYHRSFSLKGLAPGWYVWGVQAIDQDFEGSNFVRGRFYYDNPTFIPVMNTTTFPFGLPEGFAKSDIHWGDYDDNGEIDLAVLGETGAQAFSTQFYLQAAGAFVKDNAASFTLPQLRNGALDWGDFDNDGDLDLAISGESASGPLTRVYLRTASGFSSSFITLQGVRFSALQWGDFNNDGFLDLAVAGESATGPVLKIYVNNGAGAFGDTLAGFPGVRHAAFGWADYNLDGFLDFFVSGENASGNPVSTLYVNNRRGGFNVSGIGFTGLRRGSVEWGDYNRDGFPDLVVTGENNVGTALTQVWRNSNGTTFSAQGAFPGFKEGNAALCDYNLDGYLDLLLVGQEGALISERSVRLYQWRPATNNFAQDTIAAAAFPRVNEGARIRWADFDRDGKPDLVVTGSFGFGPDEKAFTIYKNITPSLTSRPGPPAGLSAQVNGYDLNFSWNPPTTGVPTGTAPGLTYNLYVGSTPGGVNRRSPMSITGPGANGWRKVANFGRNAEDVSWTWKNVPGAGTYYWSVQAIDADLEGSAFAAEQSVVFEPPSFVDSTSLAFGHAGIGVSNAAMAWADFDRDGDLDLVVTGATAGGPSTTLYRNDGAAGFVAVTGLGLRNLSGGSATWVDFDRDQRLDLLLTGADSAGNAVTALYRNTGSGFTRVSGQFTTGLKNSAAAWMDYDRDGDEDVVILGEENSGARRLWLYQNLGNGAFSAPISIGTGVRNGALAWGDFDRDGFPDLAVTGNGATGNVSLLLRNNRNKGFVDVTAGANLPALSEASLAWADFNRDGAVDLLFSGNSAAGRRTGVLRNTGGGSFVLVNMPSLLAVSGGAVAWGDYDRDGWIDFALIGSTPSGTAAQLFRNDQTGNFQNKAILALPFGALAGGAALAWADYNGDDQLDLALAGADNGGVRRIQLLKNVNTAPVFRLPAPGNLSFQAQADTVRLTWTAPTGASSATTYQVYLGSAPATPDRISPGSHLPTGRRWVARAGHTGASLSLPVMGLSAGTYFWSVQAIDQDFEGSPFAPEATFNFVPPSLVNATAVALPGGAPSGLDLACLSWVDMDGDGDLDLASIGRNEAGNFASEVYLNANGVLTRSVDASNDIPDARNGVIRWADLDGDGDMDVYISGETAGGARLGHIYRNNGAGRFSMDAANTARLVNLIHADAVWADLDQDGDPDLVVIGDSSANGAPARLPCLRVYENTNGALFRNTAWEAGLPEVFDGRILAVDFDKNGYPDLVITGSLGATLTSDLFLNKGVKGGFQPANAGITAVKNASLSAADFDLDGFTDLIVTGDASASATEQPLTQLYRFQPGTRTFQSAGANLLNVKEGDAQFADYTDDGYPDLLITGKTGPGVNDRGIKLYINTQAGGMTEDVVGSANLRAAASGASAAWGDFNGDGKVDLALAGQVSATAPRRALILYKNQGPNPNFRHGPPSNLQAQAIGDSVVLSWNPPAAVAGAAILPGLTYQVYLKSADTGATLLRPDALLSGPNNGVRMVAQPGAIGQRSSAVARGLGSGKYYWSVQAVEPDLEGGPFAPADTFEFVRPVLLDATQTDLSGGSPTGWDQAAMAWADINRDGFLDLLITGQTDTAGFQTRVFLNDNGRLRAAPGLELNLLDIRNGSVAWGDFNRDGFPDLALGGETSGGGIARVYANENGTSFRLVQTFGGVSPASIAWADFDRDGDLDLVIAGEQSGAERLSFFENRGAAGFSALGWGLPALNQPRIVCEDINLDGWPDLVMTGLNGATAVMRYFQNNGAGRLSATPALEIPAVAGGGLDVADVNHDGAPDLVLTGLGASGPETMVLLNTGSGGFIRLNTGLPGFADGLARFADANNDGLPDLLLAGAQPASPNARLAAIYLNQNGQTFVMDTAMSEALTAVDGGAAAAWADYNRDGNIDFALSGRSLQGGGQRHFGLYRNIQPEPPVRPAPPSNLLSNIGENYVELQWDLPPGQDSALTLGYSYNLVVGNSADPAGVVSPLAFLNSGLRLLAERGATGSARAVRLYNLPEGIYFWQVQSVDQDYEGSVFSRRDTFLFTPKAFEDKTIPVLGATLPAGYDNGALLWLDGDGDGDLDLLVSGDLGGSNFGLTYFENSGGVDAFLTPKPGGIAFKDVALSDMLPVDYDRDGDVDVLVMGRLEGSTQNRIFLLKNDGAGNFTSDDAFIANLPALAEGAMALADYDLDGGIDLFLTGSRENGAPFSGLFRHTQGGWTPVALTGDPIPALRLSACAWYDYDRDGDPDLGIMGENAASEAFTAVYENKGNGEFRRKTGVNFEQVRRGSLIWTDTDNDGYGDLIFTGETGAAQFEPITRLYRYDSTASQFVRVLAPLVNVSRGAAIAGDYNSDGWPDLLVTGKRGAGANDRATRLYRNNGQGGFLDDANTSASLVDADLSAAAWGDYDGDGKLDLALMGRSLASPVTRFLRLYHNLDTAQAQAPGPPTGLGASIAGSEITLAWDPPAGYAPALARGLTYNLWIGESGAPFKLASPLSDTTSGFRRVASNGLAGQRLSYTFRKPPNGVYRWAVQAIDAQFLGSAFARGAAVIDYVNPIPEVISSFFPPYRPTDSAFVTAFITVNRPDYVDRVEIHRKGIAEAGWQVEEAPLAGTQYRFQISAPKQDEQGVAYFFKVVGRFGFDAQTDTQFTYIRFVDTGLVVPALKFGRRQGDYNLLSFPLELDNPKVEDLFSSDPDFGKYNIYRWRFWDFENGERREYTDGLTQVQSGRGYWLITKKQASLNTGAGITVAANDREPFVIPLRQGWNLIGNPYRFNLAWSDVREYNLARGDTVESIFTFNGTNIETNRVDRFSGGWLFADRPYNLRIPVRKNPAVQREAMPQPVDLSQGSLDETAWMVNLQLFANGLENGLSGFGMHPSARLSKDSHDRINLPRLDSYVEAVFPHPDYFAPRFMRDIRPSDKEAVWDFYITASQQQEVITIRWNPATATGGGSQRLILFDRERQLKIDMATQEAYGFLYEGGQHRFRAYFGADPEASPALQPERIAIGDPQPNPSRAEVSIPVSLPPTGEHYRAFLTVYDDLGRTVWHSRPLELGSGFGQVNWNGTDYQGNILPSGLYLAQVRIESGTSEAQKTLRILRQ